MHYDNGEFVLDNLPSEKMMDDIRSKLTKEEEAQFNADMEMIRDLQRKPVEGNVFDLKPQVLDVDIFEVDPVEE